MTIKIGGIQPVTLLDYPQKVSAILFLSGCNMRCPFCYNPNLVLPELIEKNDSYDENDVFDFLKERKKYLDGVVITGGEPLMQNDIVKFIRQIKRLGYSVKIDTNGLTPLVIQELLDKKFIDYIAMDIKGPVEAYKKFCGVDIKPDIIKQSIDIVKNSSLPYEFRSTLVKGLHKKNDIAKMAQNICGAKKFYLQNFNRPGKLVSDVVPGQGFTLLNRVINKTDVNKDSGIERLNMINKNHLTGFTKKEMEELRDMAGREVEKCIIR